MFVMEDILPPLYCKLLAHFNESMIMKSQNNLISKNKVYDLFPCPIPSEPWDVLARAVFPLMSTYSLLWSKFRNGSFLKCNESFLLSTSDASLDHGGIIRLESLLLKENLPVVLVSKELVDCFLVGSSIAGVVNSALVRQIFHSNSKRLHPVLIKDDQSNPWEQVVDSALFLLSYAMLDLRNSNNGLDYAVLQGLELLPLENQTMGTISDPETTEWLFIVSESEKSILHSCRHRLVSHAATIRTDILKHLEHDEFRRHCNVKRLESIDFLKLLTSLVPKNWLDCNTVIGQSEFSTTIDHDWILSLWTYILDKKLVELFVDVFPLIPVRLTAQKLTTNRTIALARLSSKTPILLLSSAGYGADFDFLVHGLQALGIFVLDEQACSAFAHHPDFKVLCHEGGRGILNAFKICSSLIKTVSLQWTKQIRLTMRKWILLEILPNLTALQQDEQELLWSLPIWLTYSSMNSSLTSLCETDFVTKSQDLNSIEFVSLSSSNVLGPIDVETNLLDDNYLWTAGANEVAMFRKLGFQQLTIVEYFANDALERVRNGKFTETQLRAIGLLVLNKLVVFQSERPDVVEALSACPLFPNDEEVLKAANVLYDPDVAHLKAILPLSYFPSKEYCSDAIRLTSLKQLGLKKVADCDGIIGAVKSIENDQRLMMLQLDKLSVGERFIEQLSPYKPALERSKSIMLYLESNIEGLLTVCDAPGLLLWNKSRQSNEDVQKLGGLWGNELRSIWWIAVFVSVPEPLQCQGLPWPSRTHRFPFAAASQTGLQNSIWLTSSTLRISTIDIHSPLLLAVLGWDQPLSGISLALQLTSLGAECDSHWESVARGIDDSIRFESMKRSYDEVFVQLFGKLNDCFETESELSVNAWITLLINKPIIWVNQQGKFVETARFALKSVLSVSTEPFLFVVPSHFQKYENFLSALRVKNSFQAVDLSHLTVQLHQSLGSQALSTERCSIHVGIIDVMLQLLEAEKSPPEVSSPVVAEDIVTFDDTDIKKPKAKLTKSDVLSLGPIFIPDSNNILAPAISLFFNDAPWLSSALLIDRYRNLRFVSGKFDNERAELLGCKSLRELLFAGEDVICPTSSQLKALVEDDSIKDVMFDLMHIAEHKQCDKLEIFFDPESFHCLLLPGLANTQGPSLMFHFPQCILTFVDISKFLVSASFISNETGKPVKIFSQSGELLPSVGKRLISSFSITDCLQICMFLILVAFT
jgi:hypothetical protein